MKKTEIFKLLTPFEKSVFDLMENQDNHRILIDGLFDLKLKHYNKEIDEDNQSDFFMKQFQFFLLSKYGQICFLKKLSNDDFLYFLKKLNLFVDFYHSKEKHHLLSLFCLHLSYEEQNYNLFDNKENLFVISFFSLKAFNILTNQSDLSDLERKLLWLVFSFCENISYHDFPCSLSSFLLILKRDKNLIKDVIPLFKNKKSDAIRDVFVENILIHFLKDYLCKHGVHSFDKIKAKIIKWLTRLDFYKITKAEIFFYKDITEILLSRFSLVEMSFIQEPNDLNVFLQNEYHQNISLLDLQTNKNLPSSFLYKNQNRYGYTALPHIFLRKESALRMDFVDVYAKIYLNWVQNKYPNIHDRSDKFIYHFAMDNIILESKIFDLFIAFHYRCYHQEDDVFNQDNPYCFDKNRLLYSLKNTLKETESAIMVLNEKDKNKLKNLKETFAFFIDDIDDFLYDFVQKSFPNGLSVNACFRLYICDKDKKWLENNKSFLKNCTFSDSFKPSLMLIMNELYAECLPLSIEFFKEGIIKREKEYIYKFHSKFDLSINSNEFLKFVIYFIHVNEVRHKVKKVINKWIENDEYGFFNSMIYYYEMSWIFHNDEQLKKNFQTFIEMLNVNKNKKLILKMNKQNNQNYLRLFIHLNLNKFIKQNDESSFELSKENENNIQILSKPIRLDYDYYFLKQEIPQIEYWIEQ